MNTEDNRTTNGRFGNNPENKSLLFYLIIIAIVVILAINYIATIKPIDKIVLLEDETTKIATTTPNPFKTEDDTEEQKSGSFSMMTKRIVYSVKSIFGLASCTNFNQVGQFNIDENRIVCYGSKELSNINVETFESIDSEYFKDKNGVYQVLQPDPDSHLQPYLILNLDPGTVKTLGSTIIKDKDRVYRRDNEISEPILMTEADASTFDIFSPCSGTGNSVSYYYADENRIYTDNGPADYIDNATFEYFGYYSDHSSNPTKLSYAKDNHQVYVGCGRILKEADPVTFTDLKSGYAKDGEKIWYLGNLISQADTTSFTILNGGYSKDKNNVYYNDNVMMEADPQSFTVVKTDLNPDYKFYVLDKNNIYHNGAIFNATTTPPTNQ